MKSKLAITIACLSILFSCNSPSPAESANELPNSVKEEVVRELTPEELKEQLKQKECQEATDYLDGNMSCKQIYKGLLSTKVIGIKVNCTITSTATAATFKNMVAHVSLLSKTDAVVIEEDITIYEFIQPGGTFEYKGEIECTNQQWEDIDHFQWSFESAECE